MVGIEAMSGSAEEYKLDEPSRVAGSVGFTGGVTGVVYVQIGETFAPILASKMLRMSEHEVAPELAPMSSASSPTCSSVP